MVFVEGVILVKEDILVLGRRICQVDGMAPGPHSSTTEAHPGGDIVPRNECAVVRFCGRRGRSEAATITVMVGKGLGKNEALHGRKMTSRCNLVSIGHKCSTSPISQQKVKQDHLNPMRFRHYSHQLTVRAWLYVTIFMQPMTTVATERKARR